MKNAIATLGLLAIALPTWSGNLDAPGAPAAGSGMPSTADIYNRLNSGAAVSVPGTFQEPAAGPTAGTGKTLGDIAAQLPAPDNTNGATTADVANGKTFWGLRTDGTWGLTSGTTATGNNVTGANGVLSIPIPDAFYTGGKTATAVDSNLQPGNIKNGVSIFGVAGTSSQASGTAAAADVLTGKTFSNSSATGVSGTMANIGAVAITPGTVAQPIPAGYHNGAGSVGGDASLVAGNIRSGATIFGVNGTASQASGTAAAADVLTGKTFSNASATGVSGTMANIGALAITPGTAAQPIPAGYHSGAGSVAGDASLVAGNIKSGATIFGVNGTASQASGTAAATDVLTGKTFSNSSATGVSGTMANIGAVAITPGTVAQPIPAGYHNGAGSVAGDANLVAGNIKSGASIFGVSGSSNVVDTTVATATAADIRIGRTAYVNGVLVTGTLVSLTACPSGWSGANCDTISKPFTAGAVPTYASTPWKCVSDSTTGLVWEVKTTDGGLHDWNHTYTWYDSTFTAHPGTANGGICNGSGCDTEKFVAAVNAEQLCGYTNWRMPSVSELQGLVLAGQSPSIHPAYFPNTVNWMYLSGASYAPAPAFAWAVDFYDGYSSSFIDKSANFFVRLVRSGP